MRTRRTKALAGLGWTGLAGLGLILAGGQSFAADAPAQPSPTPAVRPREAGPAATPPGAMMGPPAKIEWFLGRPGRVMVRDVTDIGSFDAREAGASIHLKAVVAYDQEKPAERVRGMALTLTTTQDTYTFLFDQEQVPEIQAALDKLAAVAAKLRVPPADVGRRAVYVVNGLEIGMAPAGANAGHLGRVGPDEPAVHLGPEHFIQLRDLLERTHAALARDEGGKGEG